jgi:hypothetical protein
MVPAAMAAHSQPVALPKTCARVVNWMAPAAVGRYAGCKHLPPVAYNNQAGLDV